MSFQEHTSLGAPFLFWALVMKSMLRLNYKRSVSGLESSGVNSCNVSTLLLVYLKKEKGGRELAYITEAKPFSMNTLSQRTTGNLLKT